MGGQLRRRQWEVRVGKSNEAEGIVGQGKGGQRMKQQVRPILLMNISRRKRRELWTKGGEKQG